jgi:hypothetical protein
VERLTPLDFRGIPIFVTDLAPLTKRVLEPGPDGVPWVPERGYEDVDYTIIGGSTMQMKVLVHPDRWEAFKRATEALPTRQRGATNDEQARDDATGGEGPPS